MNAIQGSKSADNINSIDDAATAFTSSFNAVTLPQHAANAATATAADVANGVNTNSDSAPTAAAAIIHTFTSSNGSDDRPILNNQDSKQSQHMQNIQNSNVSVNANANDNTTPMEDAATTSGTSTYLHPSQQQQSLASNTNKTNDANDCKASVRERERER